MIFHTFQILYSKHTVFIDSKKVLKIQIIKHVGQYNLTERKQSILSLYEKTFYINCHTYFKKLCFTVTIRELQILRVEETWEVVYLNPYALLANQTKTSRSHGPVLDWLPIPRRGETPRGSWELRTEEPTNSHWVRCPTRSRSTKNVTDFEYSTENSLTFLSGALVFHLGRFWTQSDNSGEVFNMLFYLF